MSNNLAYCEPFADGVDLFLNEKNHFVSDMMVICDPKKVKSNGIYGAPDLVVEVLSISTTKNDRGAKKNAYEKTGVQEYWIVNPTDKSVEQYLLVDGHLELNEVYWIHPDDMLETMTEEEKAAIVTHFQCSLFDDLDIALEDIFYRIL